MDFAQVLAEIKRKYDLLQTSFNDEEASNNALKAQASGLEEQKRLLEEKIAQHESGTVPPPPPTVRKAHLHPFDSDTFSNISVGRNIQHYPDNDIRTLDLLKGNAQVAGLRWSVPIVRATLNDPVVRFFGGGASSGSGVWEIQRPDGVPLRIPNGVLPGEGTDRHLTIIQPDGKFIIEAWLMEQESVNVWYCTWGGVTDITGQGMDFGARASGISQIHGQIRKEEVAARFIPHTLSFSLANDQFKYDDTGEGWDGRDRGLWPARRQDGGDFATETSGSLLYGSMFSIPLTVNIDAIPNLTPIGKALAWTLQNFGAHALIRATSMNITAEPEAERLYPAEFVNLRTDFKLITPYLRVVSNNTKDNVAGGGERVYPRLPEVVAGY